MFSLCFINCVLWYVVLMAVEHLQLPLTLAGAVGLCSSTENQALAICAKSDGLLLIKETLPWYKGVLEDLVRNQVYSIFNKKCLV